MIGPEKSWAGNLVTISVSFWIVSKPGRIRGAILLVKSVPRDTMSAGIKNYGAAGSHGKTAALASRRTRRVMHVAANDRCRTGKAAGGQRWPISNRAGFEWN